MLTEQGAQKEKCFRKCPVVLCACMHACMNVCMYVCKVALLLSAFLGTARPPTLTPQPPPSFPTLHAPH